MFGRKKRQAPQQQLKSKTAPPASGASRVKASLLSLEQRLMFDAAAAATAAEVNQEQVAQEQAEAAVSSEGSSGEPTAAETESQDLLQAIASYNPGESRTEVVFVDPSVPNYGELLSGMDPNIEVIMLDGGQDGVEQIAAALSGRSGIDAVHLISHGDAGTLQLGTGMLNVESMSGQYADEMATIQQALSEQADILVYGCDFAEGDVGQAAVTLLADLTGADVQASNDETGHISLGGDWEFEVSTGTIETSQIVGYEAQMNWAGILGTETVSDTFSAASYSNNNGTQSWSTSWSETDASGGGASGGDVRVNSSQLRIDTDTVGNAISRQVNLSNAASATLTFTYTNSLTGADRIEARVSTDGGTNYQTLSGGIFSSAANTGSGTATFDLSSYMSANTRIQFIVTATGGGERLYVDNVQISYETNNAPAITSNGAGAAASISVAENTTTVTTVAATDADTSQTLTYSISGGADAAKFAINSSTGALSFASAPNYEAPTDSGGNNVYDVTVQVSDGQGGTDTQAIAVTVANANEAPTDLVQSAGIGIDLNADGGNSSYLYTTDGGAILGGRSAFSIEAQFSATSVPVSGEHRALLSYATTGSDNEVRVGIAQTSASTCQLTLTIHNSRVNLSGYDASGLFDGEQHQLGVTWSATNGGYDFYVDGQLVGSGTGLQTGYTTESTGTLVVGMDQDSVGGGFQAGQAFEGTLHDVRVFNDVRTAAEISAYLYQDMSSSESGLVADWTMNDLSGGSTSDTVAGRHLTVGSVSGSGWEASTPSLAWRIVENASNGTVVGTVTGTDPDSGDTKTYSLTDTAGGRFAIDSATGELTVADSSLLDYEAATSHSVTVRVMDSGGLTYDETFTINLTNVTESLIANDDSASGNEDSAINGNVLLNDTAGDGGPLTASLVSGPSHGSLTLNADGSYSYTPDLNWHGTDSFQYLVNDGSGLTHYWGLEGNGTDTVGGANGTLMNDPTTIAGQDGTALQFDGVNDYVVLPDLTYTNEFSLSFSFRVADNSGTGIQYFYSHGGVGTQNSIHVSLAEASYSNSSVRNNLVTTVWDSNDPTSGQVNVDISSLIGDGQWHSYTMTVSAGGGTQVYVDGVLSGSMARGGDAINPTGNAYIGARSDLASDRFLNAGSCMDSVALFNHALAPSEITNLATDPIQATVTLTVNPVNDAPSFTSLNGTPTFTEGGSPVVLDSNVTITDTELTAANNFNGATLTLTRNGGASSQDVFSSSGTLSLSGGNVVVGGTTIGTYTNSGGTLAMTFNSNATNTLVNSAMQQIAYSNSSDAPPSSVQVNWTFSDGNSSSQGSGGALSATGSVTISITSVNDAPTDLVLSANTVTENAANGTVVGMVTGTDVDTGDTKSYSFTDSAGGRFAINSSTGEITVANSSLLIYEQATSHTVTVRVIDSGGLTYDETFTINVTNVNEAPTGADATITMTEDTAQTLTTANFGFTDVDAGDSLSAVRIDTIPTAGTLTLSGSAVTAGQVITVADITAGNLVFTPAADATGTGYASLTFSVRDSNNAYDAAPNTLTVDVTAVNDAPVVTVDPSDVNFTEQSPVGIDVNLTISDIDSGTMTGATVRISANYESGADELALTDQNGITGTWNSTNGTLTLSGTASVADYQTALRSITFYNGSDTPSPLTRTIEWIVTDGADPSAAVYRDIMVTAQNDAPVLDLDADNSSGATGADYQVTFTENGGAVSIVDAADALLIDVDGGNLMGLTVTLSNPLDGASEVLTANTSGTSIVAVYNSGTGVLTLSGSDSIANYQQVLRTIQYSNSSEAPNLTSRVLYVVAEDGTEYSNTAMVTVTMVGVNDAPVNTVPGAQAATEDTALVLSGISVNDVDGNLSTVQLGVLNGTVSVTLQGGATISAGSNGTNTLTLSGSQADINATLATLVYQGTLNYYGTDTLTVTSTDTNSVSDVDTVAITVTTQNDAPVVTAVGPTVTFVEGGSPQVIGPLMTVTDVDSTNLDTGVLTIALTQNGTADDRLQVGNFGTGPGQVGTSGSSVTYEGVVIGTASGGTNGSDPLVITFNANATVAAVQEVVTSIQFHNVSESPSTATRQVTFELTDGDGGTATPATKLVNVQATNDAPTDLTLSANTVTENAANGTVVGTVMGTDVDTGDTKSYSFTDSAGGRFAINSSTGEITVANSSLLDYESATSHSVTVRVTDSGGLTYDEVFTINVTNVNDTPTGADATITINEDTVHTLTTAHFGFTDVDAGDSLSAVRIDTLPGAGTLTLSGVAVTAGQVITVADITGGNLVFTPAADATGTGYASLTFSVRDSNNAYDAAPNTLTVDATAVNDAPIRTAGTVSNLTVSEDAGLTSLGLGGVTYSPGGSADESGQALTYAVTAIPSPSVGTVFLADGTTPVTVGSYTLADIQGMQFKPAANASGVTAFQFNVYDSGGTANGGANTISQFILITVTAVNDAPTITDLSGDSLAYSEGDGAVVIEQGGNALVADVDSTNFDTGTLTVSFTAGSDSAEDVLSIRNQGNGAGQIGVSGSNITYGGTVIGTYAGGSGSTLVITFNGNATPAAVTALTQHITYENTDTGAPTTGARTVRYTLTDGDGGTSANYDTTVLVSGANDVSVNTVPGAQTVTEDTPLVISGISVSDADGNLSTVQLAVGNGTLNVTLSGSAGISSGSNGTNTLTLSGSQADINATLATLVYQGMLNYNGADTLTVTSTDTNSGTDVDTVAITVNAVNDAPVLITNEGATVDEGSSIVLSAKNLETVDVDNGAGQVLYTITALPISGTILLKGTPLSVNDTFTQEDIDSGIVEYQHDGGETDSDSFTFVVDDGAGGSVSESTFKIGITPVNDAPTDLSLSANTVPENAPNGTVVGTVSGTDPDSGDTKSYSLTDTAGGRFAIDSATGVITVANSSLLNYEQATSHTLTVRVTDSGGLTYDETFTINLTNVNEAPAGVDATITINEDTAHALTTANFGFSDVDAGDTMSAVRIDTLPSAGSLTLSGVAITAGQVVSVADITAGNLVFTPAANANGTGYASVTFSVRDSNNAYDTAPNTLTFDVAAVNDAPVNTVPGAQTAAEDQPLAVSGISVTDVDDNLSTVQLEVLNGTVLVTLQGGASISAGSNGTNTLTLSGSQAAINATLATLVYQGSANYSGSDTLTVTSTDANSGTDMDTVAITVTAVGDATVVTGGTSGTGTEDTVLTGTLTATDAEGLSDGTVFTVSGAATHGVASIDPATGLWSYTPMVDWHGSDSFTVTITDDAGHTATQVISVTVTPVNDAPVLNVNTGSTALEGGTDSITASELVVTDVDTSAAQLTYSIGTGPAYGRLELTTAPGIAVTSFTQADIDLNQLVYVHDGSETTSDNFTFTVSDGAGGALGLTTVTLTITPVNDTPGIVSGGGGATASLNVAENVCAITIVIGEDVDLPGQALTYSVSGGADQALFAIDATTGNLCFTAPKDFEVATDADGDNVYVVQVQVTDSQGATVTQTIQVTVTDVAEALASSSKTLVVPSVLLPTSAQELGKRSVSVATERTEPPSTIIQSPATEQPLKAAEAVGLPGGGMIPLSQPPVDRPAAVVKVEDLRRYEPAPTGSGMPRWNDPSDPQSFTILPVELEQPIAPGPSEEQASLSDILIAKLDAMTESLEDAIGVEEEQEKIVARVAALSGTTLSVGFVAWAVRSSALLASCLTTLPAWKSFDPLPVVRLTKHERDRRRQETDAIQRQEQKEFGGLEKFF